MRLKTWVGKHPEIMSKYPHATKPTAQSDQSQDVMGVSFRLRSCSNVCLHQVAVTTRALTVFSLHSLTRRSESSILIILFLYLRGSLVDFDLNQSDCFACPTIVFHKVFDLRWCSWHGPGKGQILTDARRPRMQK
ncbi:hypothetical protein QUC31_017217 [Theobroma cacao]